MNVNFDDVLALGPSLVFSVATTSHSKPPSGISVRLAHTSTELWLSSTIKSEYTIVTVAAVRNKSTTNFTVILTV